LAGLRAALSEPLRSTARPGDVQDPLIELPLDHGDERLSDRKLGAARRVAGPLPSKVRPLRGHDDFRRLEGVLSISSRETCPGQFVFDR
jgi:hypothetical protein